MIVAALAAVIGTLALLWTRRLPEPPESTLPVEPAVAYDSAMALARAGRHLASVPYYKRAIAGLQVDAWEPHFNLAGALYNATTMEYTDRAGVPMTATRSSVQRSLLLAEALTELDRAAALAPSRPVLARILSARADLLYVYGFPWDAFVGFRQAQFADSTRTDLARKANACMDLLANPLASSRGMEVPSVPSRPAD